MLPVFLLFTKRVCSFYLTAWLGIKSSAHIPLGLSWLLLNFPLVLKGFLGGGERSEFENNYYSLYLLVMLCLATLRILFF